MELFKLFGTIAVNNSDANKAIDDTTGKAEKSETRMTSAFKKIGAAVATFFAVDKIITFGKSVVTTTASFEDGMLKVQSLTGATSAEYEKLSQAALNYGSTTAWTAKDVSDAMGYMALAGFNTNQILEATSGMLSLASASGEDLATVTDILTDSMTGFGDSASDANRYADVLATTQAKSNTTVGDLGEAFKYVSSLAGTYSYSLEDVSAALGVMANAGVKGSMAGTALSSIITRLGTNTSGARTAIEKLGISFYNQDGTARALGDVIKDLCDATAGMDVEQKAALASTVAGAEAQKGLLAILNQGSGAYTDLQDKLNNCTGAANDMASNMESGLGGAIRSMSSAWEGFKINLGEKFEEPLGNAISKGASWLSGTLTPNLMNFIDRAAEGFSRFKSDMEPAVSTLKNALGKLKDAFQPIVDVLSPVVDKIQEYSSEGKIAEGISTVLSGAVDALAGGISLAADIFGVIANAVKKTTDFFKEHKAALELLGVAVGTVTALIIAYNASFIAGTAMYTAGAIGINLITAATTIWTAVSGAASVATTALGAAFTFLTSPIGIIILAIGAAVAVGVLLYKNWDKIKEVLLKLWDKIKEIWGKIRSFISDVVDAIKEKIEVAISTVKNIFTGFVNVLSTIWETIKNVIKVAIMFIAEIIKAGISLITLPWRMIWENCKEYIIAAWETIKNVVSTVLDAIRNVIETVWTAISNFLTPILEGIKNFCQFIWNTILTGISTVLSGIFNVIMTVWNAVSAFLTTILNGIKNVFETVWNAIKTVITTVLNAIKWFVTAEINGIKDIITVVLNIIKTVFTTIWNGIKTVVTNVISGIRNVISNGLNGAKDVVSNILGAIKDKFASIFESAKNIVKNAIDKIKSFFHFEWSLPNIKLPHFSIDGKFNLNPPSIPHFNVDWYDKAMRNPIIMTQPTAFGINKNGQIMAGGESGNEVVSGEAALMEIIAKVVDSVITERNKELLAVLYRILDAVVTADDNMGRKLRAALDGMSLKLGKREFGRLVRAVEK